MRWRFRMQVSWRVVRLAVLAVLAAATILEAGAALGQISFGATLTVLRGTVSVVRGDGSAIAPARSGQSLSAGDRVATVGRSSALVTFFDGSEVELGADTTIAIQEAAGNGNLVTIIIENILGSTLHTVATLANPGSTYQILAGGTVTEVRGTTLANGKDDDGNVTTFLIQGQASFPGSNNQLQNG